MQLKQTLLNNWNFFRALRLILGVIITVQGIASKDWIFSIAGIYFTLMPLLNMGCCGTGTCYTQPIKNNQEQKEITYEEVGK
jgi:hypothetical protein